MDEGVRTVAAEDEDTTLDATLDATLDMSSLSMISP
jgi:hypothetical protein